MRIAVLAAVAALAAGSSWQVLPHTPVTIDPAELVSVWTGKQMLVFGRAAGDRPANVAAAYDVSDGTWRRLAAPLGPNGAYLGNYSAVWTGSEMLVWGAFDVEAFDPNANQWRRLPSRPGIGHAGGTVVWTGREMIGWGGGCCGDAFSDGVAYNPSTNKWRSLPKSPLAGSQHPLGVWTGRELLVFVGNFDPSGKRWPKRLARAAAYNPTTNRWRRIASMPAPALNANAVWDGREVLVVGGSPEQTTTLSARAVAYNPRTNRWRKRSAMPSARSGAVGVWDGTRLLVWGGVTGSLKKLRLARQALAYNPRTNRWARLPQGPLPPRASPTGVWTGRELIVCCGETASSKPLTDAAALKTK